MVFKKTYKRQEEKKRGVWVYILQFIYLFMFILYLFIFLDHHDSMVNATDGNAQISEIQRKNESETDVVMILVFFLFFFWQSSVT